MAWTTLDFPFGSQLPASKLTQMQDNFAAVMSKAAGAPVLANNYVNAAMLAPDSVGASEIAAGAVGASEIAAGAVGASEIAAGAVNQSKLKIASGIVSLTGANNTFDTTLAGGAYGFYVRVRVNSSNGRWAGGYTTSTGFLTRIRLLLVYDGGTIRTVYVQQHYIQASPPYNLGDGDIPLFIFALVNKKGDIEAIYSAPEAPWHNNGPTNIRPNYYDKQGRGFNRVRQPINRMDLARGILPQKKLIEVTQTVKNADMDLIPHPFQGNDLAGKTIVLIDPVSDLVNQLFEAFEDQGDELCDLFYDRYLTLDNTQLQRKGPKGVMCHTAKWRQTK